MTSHDNVTDIVERFRKVEGSSPDRIGISTNWYRNPDGPEAADLIEAQQADLAKLRKQVENAREALERISSGRSSVTECSLIARQALSAIKGDKS